MSNQKLLILIFLILSFGLANAEPKQVRVKGGIYEPFFKEKKNSEEKILIKSLLVDKYPVSNLDFLNFVSKNPDWSRSKIKKIFSDVTYLQHWNSDYEFSESIKETPVVNISWFAASAYCKSRNSRLLTVNEWEYVSDASSKKAQKLVMDWYAKPNAEVSALKVNEADANKFGLVGMHGLVWEWVQDFSSIIIKTDSRSTNDREIKMFCGSGSLGAISPEEYSTFMRFAFRSGLKARYSVQNLGFRCAQEVLSE